MSFPVGWSCRARLEIQASQVVEDLTDFPLLITEANLPLCMFDADGSNPALPDGGDIRFSLDHAGNTQLACEVVSFSTDKNPLDGKAEIWVKIPSLSASVNTDLYVWWSKPDATQPLSSDPYGSENVWESAAKGVWHLEDDPSGAAPQEKDSTANQNDGTSEGAMTSDDLVEGQAGKALSFDGVDDYVDCGNDESLNITDAITIEAWIYPKFNAFGDRGIAGNALHTSDGYKGGAALLAWTSSDTDDHYWKSLISNQAGSALNAGDSSKLIELNKWQHVVMTYNNSVLRLYLNGVQISYNSGSGCLQPPSPSNPTVIAKHPYANNYFNGLIDEVRVYNRALSAEEIAEHYYNQNDPASFTLPHFAQLVHAPSSLSLNHSPLDPVISILRDSLMPLA